MGFFTKENCICCNKEIGITKQKTLEGFICPTCINECLGGNLLSFKSMELKDIKDSMNKKNENNIKLEEFKASKKVGLYLFIDSEKKQFIFPGNFGSIKNSIVHSFEDVLEVEILEDGDSITKSNGVGRAVVGGLVFGVAGALIGGVTGKKKTKTLVNSLKVKVTLNDIINPVKYIDLIVTKTKSDSFSYKSANSTAQEILSLLTIVKSDTQRNNNTGSFCTSCGTQVIENQSFCGKCGTRV